MRRQGRDRGDDQAVRRLLRWLRLSDDYGLTVAGTVVAITCLVVGLVAAAVLAGSAVERRNCHFTAESMDRDGRYDFFAGCFVRLSDGTEVPLESYRATNEEGR